MDYTKIKELLDIDFNDIITVSKIIDTRKLRIYLIDKTYVDIFFVEIENILKFSIHWELTHIDNKIYRVDNIPDKQWSNLNSFPTHFHSESYENVIESPFSGDIIDIIYDFFDFIRKQIISKNPS